MLNFPLHDLFFEDVTLEEGGTFPVSIQRVSDREFPALDFSPPRLICRVRPQSLLHVGHVISRAGVRYVLARLSVTPDYRSFWMFEANRLVEWKKPITTTHALTGREKSAGMGPATSLWVGWEIMTRQPYERAIGVSNETTRIITGANVEENDLINGQQVKRVNEALGLKIVEVS